MRRFLIILTVLALLAAACGDDDTAGDDTVTTDPPADEGTDDDTDDDDTDEGGEPATDPADPPDDATDDDGTDEGGEEIALTDSYRGVTADSLTIGVAYIDAAQTNELFDVGLTEVPVEEMYAAWSAALNDAGGINGRDVLIEGGPFLPVGGGPAEELCLKLMEDEEVFVVIGQFLQSNMLCITESYGHPYVGHFGETPERQERSDGLFFATEIAQVDQRVGGTRAMIEAGDFDGKAVAVVWQDPVDEVYAQAVLPVLEDADVDVVLDVEIGAITTDTINNEQAWDIAIQRILAQQADVILNLSGIVGVLDAVGRAGADLTIAHTNGQAADGTTVVEESTSSDEVRLNSFAVTTLKPNDEESLADPGVQECIAQVEQYQPDVELDLTNSDYVSGVTNHCRAFALTVAILEAAGGDITPETFREAGEGLGEIELPAMDGAYLGPDSHSAGSLLNRYEYDAAAGQYVRVGDPIPTR